MARTATPRLSRCCGRTNRVGEMTIHNQERRVAMKTGWLPLTLTAIGFAVAGTGCATSGKTGALVGAGIGALAGQAIGQDTEGTLIGAAVGTGIGYIIGNEKDKKHAKKMSEEARSHQYTHTEVGPLGGTRWQLVNLAPRNRVPPYTSKIIEFRPYGRVITTTTSSDGTIGIADELYRVVGTALIVNKPGYMINATYGLSGNELIISADDFRAVLRRLR